MKTVAKPFAVYHEHPDWFKPLFAELDRRGFPYQRVDCSRHFYDPVNPPSPEQFSLLFNRMSPSAYLRGGGNSIFYTHSFLAQAEMTGLRVVNGSQAYGYETSKAQQLSLFTKLGINYPRARIINHPEMALLASEGLRFPIVIKANVGGSGAGIVRYDSSESLRESIAAGQVDLGVDSTALVQEFVPARGGYITRIETLGGKYLYAINVHTNGDSFNLCPADICQTTSGVSLARSACAIDAPKTGLTVEAVTPTDEVIANVEAIVQEAGIDVGGIEIMVDDRDGSTLYYDVNALSNFVADAVNVIGFDPHVRLVDYLVQEAGE